MSAIGEAAVNVRRYTMRAARACGLLLVLVHSAPAAATAQARGHDELPQYRITARVDGGWIDAVAEVVLPATLVEHGAVRIDLLSAGKTQDGPSVRLIDARDAAGQVVAPRMDGPGVAIYPTAAGSGAHALRLHYRIRLDTTDLSTLGYYLFPAEQRGSRWYPEVVTPHGRTIRFASYDVRLEWPTDWAVLTSGPARDEGVQGAWRRAEFRAEHVEGFTLALGPGNQLVRLERDGLRVDVMAPPDLLETYTKVGRRALDAAAFYRELYGFFPNDRLGLLPGPKHYSGGFPMPNVFMVHRGNLDADYVRFITAHELGHYYWGLYVLDAGERLDWLMLANGIIAEQLYLAQDHRRTLEEQWRSRGEGNWLENYLTAHLAGSEQRLGLPRSAEDSLEFDYNTLVRHAKGATGLYLQVRRIGATRFVQLQRELLQDFRFRPLDLDTFVVKLERAGATGAPAFFQRWARGDASIDYAVEAIEPLPGGPEGHRVIIRRYGTVPYPVEVELKAAAGPAERRTIVGAGNRDTLVVRGVGPLQIQLDPDGAIPMWNSANAGIRRIYLHAMYDAGLLEPFVALSGLYLADHADEAMLRRREAVLQRMGQAAAAPAASGGRTSPTPSPTPLP